MVVKIKYILGIAIVLGLLLPSTKVISNTVEVEEATIVTSNTYIDLYKNVIDSVVTIIVEVEGQPASGILKDIPSDSPFNELFKDKTEPLVPRSIGKGSGFIVTSEGLVYTNHHVIFGGKDRNPKMKLSDIVVVWHDQSFRKAKLIASDKMADVAILQIEREGEETFKPLPLGDSSKIIPGTMVASIGSPLDHPFSITSGIISGIDRSVGKGVWVTMLQTDAVINKGNSGGPLFNLKGEVIGMNTIIISPSGFFIGIGYALPSNVIQKVASKLLEAGEVIRPWIGVQLSNLTDESKEKFNIAQEAKAIVFLSIAPNGPAGKSNFRPYDMILKVNGEAMESDDLVNLIATSKPGDEIKCSVRRVIDYEKGTYEDIELILIVGKMADGDMG